MVTLGLTCLGAFTITVDDQPAPPLRTDKVRALLAYLALEARPQRRERLAGLLWPDIGEEYALKNLRNTLHRLRQPFEEVAPGFGDTLLISDRQTIALNPIAFTVDVQRFEELINTCATHVHEDLAQCNACLARLAQAADLNQGELLAGFNVADAPAFEEWLLLRREALHQQLLLVLYDLAVAHETRREWELAQRYARRFLGLEPWREEAHRLLMRILARDGQRAAALTQYQSCRQVLKAELGVEPDGETTALYEEIRAGKFDRVTRRQGDKETSTSSVTLSPLHPVTPSPPHPVTLSAVQDWGEMPAVESFAGRATEMAQLQGWLAPASATGGARLISLLGIGGMGKTTLAAAVTKAVAPSFAFVIWRSLLNAPPLAEILRNWLQILSRQTLTNLPESLDEQLRLLLDYLRQQRCLLVLDNVESILQPGGGSGGVAGETRAGYEGYGQLFQQLSASEHGSCLLLTSREQPYALVRTNRQTPAVRALPLVGLDVPAGQTVLQSNGLNASPEEAALLVKNYSGNPLALQIVGNTIADFFGGDVAAFQQEEGFLFDGIRRVLDQQFARLSDLEREILVWLAIEREAVTVHTLRSNLVHAPSTAELLGALHALQARSLLEKTGDGLTLQNVIIEYSTEYLVEQVCREIESDLRSEIYDLRKSLPDEDLVNRKSKIVNSFSPHPVTLSFLNRFALLKAQAKEYVRQSQARLILQPVLTRMLEKLSRTALEKQLRQIIATLHRRPTPSERGYAAGNILNLLLRAGFDVTGCDLSNLAVWQAYLRENTLYDVNLAHADLSGSAFVKPFNMIMALAYSPDGELLAGGSMEGAIFIWKAEDGYLANVYHGHSSVIYSVAFSPDKTMLASASQDYSIRVWDVRNGQPRFVLSDHTSFVNAVAFSPDGRLLASGSDDHTVRLWNAQSGAALTTFTSHRDRVTCVVFGADGKTLASCANDQTICLWDVEQGALIETLHEQVRPNAIAYDSLKGRIVSVGSIPTVRFWQLTTGVYHETPPMHNHSAESILFDPTYSIVASGSIDQTVRLWDAQTHETLRVLHGHREGIRAIAFSPDGQRIASTSTDRTVCQWQVQTGALLQVYSGYSGRVDWLGFDAQNELIACTSQNGQVRVWQVRSGISHHIKAEQASLNQPLALGSNSPLFICTGENNTASIRNLQDSSYHWTLEGHTAPITAVAAATGRRLFATGSRDASVRIWDVGTRKVRHILAAQSPTIWAVSFSQDQELLASDSDGTVLVWNTLSGQLLHRLEGHTHVCESFGFRHDRAILASGSQDHTICLWDIATGQLRATLHGHTGTVNALAFSPDGLLLVSGSGDMNVHIWDVGQGRLLHRLTGHSGWVMKLVFMPDGNTIATGSYDGMVKLWDVHTGACLETFQPNGPYAGMNITGVTGISAAQKAALRALGAVEE